MIPIRMISLYYDMLFYKCHLSHGYCCDDPYAIGFLKYSDGHNRRSLYLYQASRTYTLELIYIKYGIFK